jgi:hypothetical protein
MMDRSYDLRGIGNQPAADERERQMASIIAPATAD